MNYETITSNSMGTNFQTDLHLSPLIERRVSDNWDQILLYHQYCDCLPICETTIILIQHTFIKCHLSLIDWKQARSNRYSMNQLIPIRTITQSARTKLSTPLLTLTFGHLLIALKLLDEFFISILTDYHSKVYFMVLVYSDWPKQDKIKFTRLCWSWAIVWRQTLPQVATPVAVSRPRPPMPRRIYLALLDPYQRSVFLRHLPRISIVPQTTTIKIVRTVLYLTYWPETCHTNYSDLHPVIIWTVRSINQITYCPTLFVATITILVSVVLIASIIIILSKPVISIINHPHSI